MENEAIGVGSVCKLSPFQYPASKSEPLLEASGLSSVREPRWVRRKWPSSGIWSTRPASDLVTVRRVWCLRFHCVTSICVKATTVVGLHPATAGSSRCAHHVCAGISSVCATSVPRPQLWFSEVPSSMQATCYQAYITHTTPTAALQFHCTHCFFIAASTTTSVPKGNNSRILSEGNKTL